MFTAMEKPKIRLNNVKIEIERTLDKCLAWFYSYPTTKMGLSDLQLIFNISSYYS